MTGMLLWVIVVPSLFAATIYLAIARPWRFRTGKSGAPEEANNVAQVATGLALGIGYVVGHLGQTGLPQWTAAWDISFWSACIAVQAIIAGILEVKLPSTARAIRTIVRLIVCSAAAYQIVRPLSESLSGVEQLSWGSVIAAAAWVQWSILALTARRETGLSILFAVLTWGTIGSVVLVLSGSATTGQLSGTVLAAVGALTAIGLKFRAIGVLVGASPVVALVLVSHWSTAALFAEMPRISFGLLALSPVGLLISRLKPVATRSIPVRTIGRLIASGLLCAIAAFGAARIYFGHAPHDSSAAGKSNSGSASAGEADDPEYDEDYGYE